MTTEATPLVELEKRTWHYLGQPSMYEMAPCACGNHDTQWSEFKKHLWCEKCQIDFIPEHAGIFDGPIAVKIAVRRFGVTFDRYNMLTNKIERFDPETSKWTEEDVPNAPA